MENYDEVYGAVGYFIWHYGRIDWLESNNEYWLEQDAVCVQISIFRAVFITKTCHASNTNPA